MIGGGREGPVWAAPSFREFRARGMWAGRERDVKVRTGGVGSSSYFDGRLAGDSEWAVNVVAVTGRGRIRADPRRPGGSGGRDPSFTIDPESA